MCEMLPRRLQDVVSTGCVCFHSAVYSGPKSNDKPVRNRHRGAGTMATGHQYTPGEKSCMTGKQEAPSVRPQKTFAPTYIGVREQGDAGRLKIK